ncbi:uncharacterized protein LOC133415719 isoform X2 [Phycodurus eques]|uniref:uncharacterized protein LOC133415719 isoform X2 n=1 Tax=Phycodurus eques TaxID=693459 RepID=UPI002ACEADC9|nr:uncharacterized protein LOC133415719 isoform X2 [Phycodurus eques]
MHLCLCFVCPLEMKNILWFALRFPACLECVTDVTSCCKRKPTYTLHRCCRLEPTQEGDQLDHQRYAGKFERAVCGSNCCVAGLAESVGPAVSKMQEKVQDHTRRCSNIQPAHIREGSRFAVMQSKKVTKSNQTITSSNEGVCPRAVAASPPRSWEHIYVDPLPVTVYENELTPLKMKVADPAATYYANVDGAALINDDSDEYENAGFLAQNAHHLENDLLYENEKAACRGCERGHLLV